MEKVKGIKDPEPLNKINLLSFKEWNDQDIRQLNKWHTNVVYVVNLHYNKYIKQTTTLCPTCLSLLK